MSEMVKKYHVALFIKDAEGNWVRVKKSTAFELSLNPETQDYDYITDQNPTTELLRYKPSLSQAITMYKGEPDYDIVFSKLYRLETGSAAKAEVLIVFMQESEEYEVSPATDGVDGEPGNPAVTGTRYKAWKNEAVITVNSLNTVDSTVTVDISFGGNIVRGTCVPDGTTRKPVFTASSGADAGWVDPFEPVA